MPNKVTDPSLLIRLNESPSKKVSDPALLSKLNSSAEAAAPVEMLKSETDIPSVSRGRTALEQAEQGATFGFSDEIMNMIGAQIAHQVTGEDYHSLLDEATNATKARMSKEWEQHPTLSLASQVAGGLAVPGAGAKALKVLPEAVGGSKIAAAALRGLAGGAAGGAAYGAGTADSGQRVRGAERGAITGGISGGVLGGAGQTASELAKPLIVKFDNAVKTLKDAGVKLTPGQAAYKSAQFVKRAEDALGHLPIVSGKIKDHLTESFNSFNTAVLNKALAPIGKSMPKDIQPGREAIAHAQETIGKEYDKLLPKLKFNVDGQFINDAKQLNDTVVSKLAKPQQKEFKRIIDNASGDHVVSGQNIGGTVYKKIESDVSHYQRRLGGKNARPEDLELKDALDDYLGMLRGSLERQNPAQRAELQKLNTSYALFKKAQDASIRKAASGGVFSPDDLLQTIKKSSSTGQFAKGMAPLQDLADAGSQVLPKTIPDIEKMKIHNWEELVSGAAALPVYSAYKGSVSRALGGQEPYISPELRKVISGAIEKNAATTSAVIGAQQGEK